MSTAPAFPANTIAAINQGHARVDDRVGGDDVAFRHIDELKKRVPLQQAANAGLTPAHGETPLREGRRST